VAIPVHRSAIVDFVGGASFLVDVAVTLRTGLIVSSRTLGRRKLVMQPEAGPSHHGFRIRVKP
jgi:hypothetical protein